MRLTILFRSKIYWFVDFFRNNSVSKHYQDISNIIENSESESVIIRKNKLVENLIDHVNQNVPYYTNKKLNSISDFPVIDKSEVINNFELFKSKKYINNKLFKISTSGSTGAPFTLFHNLNKRRRNTADVIYFLQKSNYKFGSKLFELGVWRKHNTKSFFKSWMQNSIQFDISKLTDSRILLLLKKISSEKDKKSLLGYSSSFESICKYCDQYQLKPNINNVDSIIASSEQLNEYTKNSLKKYFNTNIYSRYSSEELGIIAHQTAENPNLFRLNTASFFIELLGFNDEKPVQNGKYGRIVVTDLFNYAMPLIRYDTGDIAKTLPNKSTNNIQFFEYIEGRKMDLIYDTRGNILSSYVIYTKFYEYYELIKQYQFIQEGQKNYIIKLNLNVEYFSNENQLISDFKTDLGDDAIIKIIYLDEIPVLSSGKRKKVLNTYLK